MAFIPTENCVKLVTQHTHASGVGISNVIHVGDPAHSHVYTASDLLSLATAWWTTWVATSMHLMYSSTSLTFVEAFDASSETAPSATYVGTAAAGSGGIQAIPLQTALQINLNVSDLGGKGDKGKLYIGGLSQSTLDTTGAVASATRTSVAGYLATWNSALSGAVAGTSVLFVRFHRKGVVFLNGETHTVTSSSAATYMATQKRRKQGRS